MDDHEGNMVFKFLYFQNGQNGTVNGNEPPVWEQLPIDALHGAVRDVPKVLVFTATASSTVQCCCWAANM